jgi:pyruvate dehydrogenase E1 component
MNDRTPMALGRLPDLDQEETQEWLESLDAAVAAVGPERARDLVLRLLDRAAEHNLNVPQVRDTDYLNTLTPAAQPAYPGDEAAEARIEAALRWNSAALVSRANRPGVGVGGHIATYASAATLYEVGFNHFFRGKDDGGGDQLFIQGHASPGIYARAFLEGRIDEKRLDLFRQETGGGGLSSYPHPRLMPDFWEFPTVSMGLGPLSAIYQARFNRYLHNRGIKDTSGSRVYAFLGDGEMDEPESLGALSIAAREGLDNLCFVVNCNLQRLDGPVRGNGKIIQELESVFRGAGWNVIKVIWGAAWDSLLASGDGMTLIRRLGAIPDGQFQTFAGETGAYIRENLVGGDERIARLLAGLTDEQLQHLVGGGRGGHDRHKMYAAYAAAAATKGMPTVILAQTVKGYGLGAGFEAKMSNHQMKKMALDQFREMRDRFGLDVPDSDLQELPPYVRLSEADTAYLLERRGSLGGFLPSRDTTPRPLALPEAKPFQLLDRGSPKQPVATTMSLVKLLKELLKDKELGPRFVPIIPDEARTFGLDAIFPSAKVYSVKGQTYESIDRDQMLRWTESTAGQILHEGINEAGSMASVVAAGTSYATHGEPMIPVYIFYSMFGFQRTGDQFWQLGDQMGRGFIVGATAGRTTLNGEGLQHEDGHSLLLASTNPACVAYDPAFGYEVASLMRDGLRRMYGPDAENVFYYLTVYNEALPQPARPDITELDEKIARGIYRFQGSSLPVGPRAQLLASGTAVHWALEAQRMLADDWKVAADVWSVTSWNELRRDAVETEAQNLATAGRPERVPYITEALTGAPGPVVAVSDWMRAVQDQISPWVEQDWVSLGTDGFGLSDTREALRRHFQVDAPHIVVATLTQLAKRGEVDSELPEKAAALYGLLG